ncbi:MAG: hypothetical protein Q9227_005731 [Pyrenula ochraceoflavens]
MNKILQQDSNTSQPAFQETPRRRSSIFKEIGLDEVDEKIDIPLPAQPARKRPRLPVRFRSTIEEIEQNASANSEPDEYIYLHKSQQPSRLTSAMPRIFFLAVLVAIAISSLHSISHMKNRVNPIGATAGPIEPIALKQNIARASLEPRQDPTQYCKRWSQQTALVNGTVYIYGGRMITDQSQTTNTWNNDFLTLDLTKNWQISTPSLSALPQPSGPPSVANGYLWNSYESLFLYGGEFSDTPVESPAPFSLWEYDLSSKSWSEHSNPKTSDGQNSGGGNQPVQRSAEGAGVNIPEIGRGYYFGGHQDTHTTSGWSYQIDRIYLKSMIEFTFPGVSNPSISNSQAAGNDGLWRNITEGGLQDTAGFTERADGVLIYVPGYGKQGIIVGLAGGSADKFTQMNVIDVYDVDSSTWYKQATTGKYPGIRVNPCAVAASAADGTSTQIYMYGGQNLQPAGSQNQYDDMWILTIPSFTWISVDTSSQATPGGRSGHTCDIWNSQMVLVGGYVGTEQGCDYPGIYVFDTSKLSWVNDYTVLKGGNALNQQSSQSKDDRGISGSFGYQVPDSVQSIIGGNALGEATVTKPAQTATSGPMATGQPITYTITNSAGVVTATATAGGNGTIIGASQSKSSGPNVVAIVVGVIAGLLALLAAYLGFCAYLYRRQLALYKNHVAMAQRASMGLPTPADKAVLGAYNKGSPLDSSPSRYAKNSTEASSAQNSGSARHSGRAAAGYNQVPQVPPLPDERLGRQHTRDGSTASSSTEDLVATGEPSFIGVMLNPRRSLRVINRD